MCCGRGIKTAASRQYVTPSNNKEDGMVKHYDAVEAPLFAWQQQGNPKNSTPQKVGAYYGNPVIKNKAKKTKVLEKKSAEDVADDVEALKLLPKK